MYQARAIGVQLGGRAILDGVDLALSPGRVTVVVGPNGAGKSTLLKVLAGERRPSSGEVRLDGVPLANIPTALLARRRAVLPQSVHVAFAFTVAEIVTLGLPAGLEHMLTAALVARALHAVDLGGFDTRLYDQLSGGERQRVQFARVLAQLWAAPAPGYLLLDEPTLSLDLAHQLLALRIARGYAREGGGVLAVLHDINLASMAADEIVALKDGRVCAAGAPNEVVTDELIATLYGVSARVRGVPEGPFLLPQTAGA
jgi:iron complex transport system ATP-binding protein